MEFRCIKESEREAWMRLCGAGFNQDWKCFEDHYVRDPFADPEGVFVAVDGERFVSSVRVFTRQVFVGGQPISMGGIGEVTTLPEYRGQGLSSQLLRMAVDYMVRRKMPLSFLFTAVNHHYAHSGWITVPLRFLRTEKFVAGSYDGYEIRPVTEADFPLMVQLQSGNARQNTGAIVRNEAYIRNWINFSEYTVLSRNGKAVGCAQYDVKKDRIVLNEYAGDPSALAALLSKVTTEACVSLVVKPAVYALPGDGCDYSEKLSLMARLNVPFTVDGTLIDTASKLASVLSDAVFFGQDGF